MSQPINTALNFEAQFNANGVAATLLTILWDVWNPAGTKIVTDGAAVEVGGGRYRYVLSAGLNVALGNYSALAKSTDATLDQQQLPALIVVGEEALTAVSADAIAAAVAAAIGSGAADPDQCEVFGYLYGAPTGTKVTCQNATPPDVVDGRILSAEVEVARSQSDGRFAFDRTRGVDVTVTCDAAGFSVTFTVPDQASYDLSLSL